MPNIKPWAAWAEQRIAAVVVAEKLHVALLGVTQGPLTVTFRLRLMRPSPAALNKLLSLGPALAQGLQSESVRISDTAKGILVEVPSPAPRTPAARTLAQASRGMGVAVGLDQWRRPAGVNLRHHPTLLFVGPSRKGKTQAMKSTLFALAQNTPAHLLQFAIFSAKRADWTAFDHLRACMGVVSDFGEAAQALEWAAGTLLQQRAKQGITTPAVVLVLDDLINLLKRAPEVAGPIGEIASMGGGVGIYQIIGTQDAGSKRGTGGADVEANITARVVYKTASATTAARAAGAGKVGVEDLSDQIGDALLIVDGQVTRIATGLADDREIAQLSAGPLTVAPWLSATAHNRPQPPQPPVVPPTTGAHVAPRTADVGGGEDTVVAVADQMFPIEKRPPTDEEANVIAELHAKGESLTSLCKRVYGYKDRGTFDWIKAVTGGLTPDDLDGIDLSTEEGQRKLKMLQDMGLIKLPDVSGLFMEV